MTTNQITTRLLKCLYLDDLRKEIKYDNNSPRVRYKGVKTFSQFKPIIRADNGKPIDLSTTTKNIWIWSDQHFWHNNIIKFSERPFEDVNHMNKMMEQHYIDLIQPDDIVIWGGDVSFKNDNSTNELLDRLPGYKILVIGNHDYDHGKLKKLNFDETHVLLHFIKDGIDYVVTHFPMDNLPYPWINLHGHIHNRQSTGRLQVNVSVEVHYINYRPCSMDFIHTLARSKLS